MSTPGGGRSAWATPKIDPGADDERQSDRRGERAGFEQMELDGVGKASRQAGNIGGALHPADQWRQRGSRAAARCRSKPSGHDAAPTDESRRQGCAKRVEIVVQQWVRDALFQETRPRRSPPRPLPPRTRGPDRLPAVSRSARGVPQPFDAPADHDQPVPQPSVDARARETSLRRCGRRPGPPAAPTNLAPALARRCQRSQSSHVRRSGSKPPIGQNGVAVHQHGVDRRTGTVCEGLHRRRGDVGAPGRGPDATVRHHSAVAAVGGVRSGRCPQQSEEALEMRWRDPVVGVQEQQRRPRAAARPALRAAEAPPALARSRRKRGSRDAWACATAAVPSVEPSSTTMASQCGHGLGAQTVECRVERRRRVARRDNGRDFGSPGRRERSWSFVEAYGARGHARKTASPNISRAFPPQAAGRSPHGRAMHSPSQRRAYQAGSVARGAA